jgi:hypothetical protein
LADNVNVTAGTGTAIAADEVVDATLGTVKVQMIKIMDGTLDGTAKLGVYAEDAAAASDPTGHMLIARRKDTLSTTEVSADGDNIALNATNKGKLHVAAELRVGDTVIDTGVGTGGSATPRVAIDTASQNANGQATMANSAPVVMASDFVGTSGFMKKEDVASADGDAGVGMLAVRKATPANTSGTDGDYEFLQMSAGRLWGSSQAYGDIAHDAADASPPVKGGHKATTSLAGLTLVANNDVTDSFAGIDGVQIVRPHANLEDLVSGILANTDGASTSVIAAQGAGVKTYITSVIIANTSATAVTVDLRDGAAGSVKATFPVPANTSGVVCNLPVPLGFSANTAVCMDGSAAASTVTCTLIGFKSKV